MEWCLISIRTPLNPKARDSSGFLFHYGHFILDFALPFLKEYQTRQITVLYLPPNSCIGTMEPIFHALFPGIKIVNVKSPGAVPGKPRLTVRGYCRANFHTDLVAGTRLFNEYVVGRALAATSSDRVWPQVILIQRGRAGLHRGHANGTGRRSIANHAAVKQFLAGKYGADFENLMLENMNFFTQVLYFYHARVVIAQYGSGLVNVLWMKPGTACIELTARGLDARDSVFVKCCQARKVKHFPVECSTAKGTAWTVPLPALAQALEKYNTETGG